MSTRRPLPPLTLLLASKLALCFSGTLPVTFARPCYLTGISAYSAAILLKILLLYENYTSHAIFLCLLGCEVQFGQTLGDNSGVSFHIALHRT